MWIDWFLDERIEKIIKRMQLENEAAMLDILI